MKKLRKRPPVTMASYNRLLAKLPDQIGASTAEIIRMRGGVFQMLNSRRKLSVNNHKK